jgi:ABC-2 type transport system permease protein
MKSKAFRITTIILLALILIGSCVPQIKSMIESATSGGENEKAKAIFILTGDAAADDAYAELTPAILKSLLPGYTWDLDGDPDGAERAVAEGDCAVAVVYDGTADYTLYSSGHDFGIYDLTSRLDALLTERARAAAMSLMAPDVRDGAEAIIGINVTGNVQSVGNNAGNSSGNVMGNFWLSYVMLYLLFMVVMMYGQFVVTSVVNEKSTKAMELLITSTKPTYLMFGKVVGVGCVALTQMVLILGVSIVGLLINFSNWSAEIPVVADTLRSSNLSPWLIILFIFYFVLGYFLYAFIFAAMGSTVSKIEDSGSVNTIPNLLMVAAFVVSMISMSNIDATYVKILSYVPFFSPFLMFTRMSMGEAGYIEGLIALIVLAASVLFFSWFAAKIYRVGVMMYGKPMKIKEVFKTLTNRS